MASGILQNADCIVTTGAGWLEIETRKAIRLNGDTLLGCSIFKPPDPEQDTIASCASNIGISTMAVSSHASGWKNQHHRA